MGDVKRIAVSADDRDGLDSAVSPHFGRCPFFILVDLDGCEVQDVRAVENPYYARHQPGQVPGFIDGQDVDVMLTGGMGRRAISFFEQYGIQAVTGASGSESASSSSGSRPPAGSPAETATFSNPAARRICPARVRSPAV